MPHRIRADALLPGHIVHLGTKLKTVRIKSTEDGYTKLHYTNGDTDTYRDEDTVLVSDKKTRII